MKKLYFASLLCWLFSALSAQDYIPLVQEQATWIIHIYGEGYQDLYGYRIDGDTLIDNVAYKKVYHLSFHHSPPPDLYLGPPYKKSGQTLFGAIREDLAERKVYARLFGQTDLESRCTDPGAEKLWHDFSLTVGDTLPSCISHFPDNPEEVYPITSLDTSFLFGENRRLWCIWGGLFYCQVEGLGTRAGLFDPYFGEPVPGEGGFYLRHYCIGPELDCGIVDATATREQLLPASALKVFPNPAADQVHIILEKVDSGIERVSLLTLTGALLLEKTNGVGNAVDLDVRGARPGVYQLQVITSNGIAVAKIVLQ